MWAVVVQRKLLKGAQCRRTIETAAHHFNIIKEVLDVYITESLIYLPLDNAVKITLIWKTKDNIFHLTQHDTGTTNRLQDLKLHLLTTHVEAIIL